MAEIMEAVQEKEGIPDSPFLNDKASGLFNFAYGFGNFLAPLIGAALYAKIGFRSTCDYMALISLGLFVFHFFVAVLPGLLFTRKQKKQKERDDRDGDEEFSMNK